MNLKEKVSNLPSSPGVYLMKDSQNSIIYVGKSKNLKSRVGSYFVNSKSHSPKVVKLVKNIKDFEYILTDTEFEAFILECKLIKEIKPYYNKKMKNPLSYCYIQITGNAEFPDFKLSSEYHDDDGNLYFGPYTSKNTVERGIQCIKEHYKILCGSKSKKAATCLNYSLGLCIGTCKGGSVVEQYRLLIEKVVNFLNGKDNSIILELEKNMNDAVEQFDFESAAKYRDCISSIDYLLSWRKIQEFTEENENIVMLEYLDSNSFKLFLITGSQILFSEKYTIINNDIKVLIPRILDNVLLYFKDKSSQNSLVIERDEIDESQIIFSYLRNENNNCKYVVIREDWITSENTKSITESLNSLMYKDSLECLE